MLSLPRKRRLTDHDTLRPVRPCLREEVVPSGRSGCYPWDEWEALARHEGLDEAAVALGRAAWVYDWPEPLRSRCGWADNGRAMLRLARANPKMAAARWLARLQTEDGKRSASPT